MECGVGFDFGGGGCGLGWALGLLENKKLVKINKILFCDFAYITFFILLSPTFLFIFH